MITNNIDKIFKSLLQKNIIITVKNKTVKKGKLIIFSHVGCFVRLELLNGIKKEHVEIPSPFAIYSKDNNIYFDYRLSTLSDGDSQVLGLLQSIQQIRDSKYYDRVLTININNTNE